jgi:hypothetical protein
MAVIVKNPKLRSRVFKQMRVADNMALKAYSRGDMKSGKKWERISEKLYKRNYSKMFSITSQRTGELITLKKLRKRNAS